MKYVAAASDSSVSLRPDPSWLFLISGNVNIASIGRQIGYGESFLKKISSYWIVSDRGPGAAKAHQAVAKNRPTRRKGGSGGMEVKTMGLRAVPENPMLRAPGARP